MHPRGCKLWLSWLRFPGMKTTHKVKLPAQLPAQQPANDVRERRQYADVIDEDALHDQLMLAIASENAAYDELPVQFDQSLGQGMPYDLNDPIIRKPRRD